MEFNKSIVVDGDSAVLSDFVLPSDVSTRYINIKKQLEMGRL